MNDDKPNLLARLMKSASKIEPNELKSVLVSFALVFLLMAAWYILRPVRDAMASDWSATEISQLWNINFFVCIAVVAIYGFAVSHIKFAYLVPGTYAFFAASFLGFYFGTSGMGNVVLLTSVVNWDLQFFNVAWEIYLTVDKIFYIWVSVFSLYHVTVFWSFMADLFTKEQSKRLFAFIAAGASAGALVGPLIPALFADVMGNDTLMLVAALMLVVPIMLTIYLERLKVSELHNDSVQVDLASASIGGNPLAGFRMFFTNPYLLAIGAFLLLYTALGSFVYFFQTELLAPFDETTRARILASVDLTVNILTFAIGLFATSRIVTRFGMAVTLAMVPVFMAAGMLIVAFAPILIIALAVQIARRAGNYGITQPGRQMLFTAMDRETRFKAKPVIDVVVYRGGDALAGNFYAFFKDDLGFALAAMALIGAAISALWSVIGVYLGRVFKRRQDVAGVVGAELTGAA